MRILMLGNSLTTANGLPQLLRDRVGAEVAVHARGGARLSEHLNPRTRLGGLTQAALRDERWDYLVLQERSDGPVRFPRRFRESACALAELARERDAKPVLFATWAYAPGSAKLAKLGMEADEMFARMHAENLATAEAASCLLADACAAFHGHAGTPGLFAPDGVHPGPAGTQLALETLAAAIGGCRGAEASGPAPAYKVYLLACQDGSYYAGITTDLGRRLQEHLSRGPKAAKYTRTHPVAGLAASWDAADRAEASRLEYRIKRLSHAQKAALAADPGLIERLR